MPGVLSPGRARDHPPVDHLSLAGMGDGADAEEDHSLLLMVCPDENSTALARARGCLVGQLAGDALGSLVEFQSPEEIRRSYPKGVRELADGGTWNTIAGQPTDDSEVALLLARTLTERGAFDLDATLRAYQFWLDSNPFDCGMTISSGLRGFPNPDSQANGAMMRISPLGIFGANHPLETVGDWARQDAALTHPNPVCLQANTLFTMAIAHAIASGCESEKLYDSGLSTWMSRRLSWTPSMELPKHHRLTTSGNRAGC